MKKMTTDDVVRQWEEGLNEEEQSLFVKGIIEEDKILKPKSKFKILRYNEQLLDHDKWESYHDLDRKMIKIDNLIEAVGKYFTDKGPCDNAEFDNGFCYNKQCVYCNMVKAFNKVINHDK